MFFCACLLKASTPNSLQELTSGNWEGPIAAANLSFPATHVNVSDKIKVWKEVCKVPERVDAHVVTRFTDRIISDLNPGDFNVFRAQLHRRASSMPLDCRKAEWRCWWYKVYEYLNALSDAVLSDLWGLIRSR